MCWAYRCGDKLLIIRTSTNFQRAAADNGPLGLAGVGAHAQESCGLCNDWSCHIALRLMSDRTLDGLEAVLHRPPSIQSIS